MLLRRVPRESHRADAAAAAARSAIVPLHSHHPHPHPHAPTRPARCWPLPTGRYMAPGIMCFGRKADDPHSRRNEEIEKTIRDDRKKQEREVKLLLLGKPDPDRERGRAGC